MFSRNSCSALSPCLKCHATELSHLKGIFEKSDGDFWVYEYEAARFCKRCSPKEDALERNLPAFGAVCAGVVGAALAVSDMPRVGTATIGMGLSAYAACQWKSSPTEMVNIPIPIQTVGEIERAVHASKVAAGGSEFRAHGSFISHLSQLEDPEMTKQSLIAWAPTVMVAWMDGAYGVSRKLQRGHSPAKPSAASEDAPPKKEAETKAPPGLTKIQAMSLPPANADCENGKMKGTQVEADSYGVEDRVFGVVSDKPESKILGTQIGPSLIETEVMESCVSNLKAGLAKRVQPLPFKKDKAVIRKIEKTVTALIENVFSAEKIKKWRVDNPLLDEMKSKKWDSQRWRHAVEECMADINGRIEQTFQIKNNEALPAKDKAPRPIIQCGDRAQVMMKLPVKCFEELLFHHFEEASIKHLPKYDAMIRVAERLRQEGASIIEGDGSAWDSCCNPTIRKLTENRIIRHIIDVLGEDHEVPRSWMEKVMADMQKKKIKGKAKISDFQLTPIRICIESIRQSGHAGTSCFNYLINLIGWLVVVVDEPWKMFRKTREGKLPHEYKSAFDGKVYSLKYAFEGDDSALSSTEDFSAHQEKIEQSWTNMGFRMKLVFVTNKMTFTGFDFLCDKNGPTGIFLPEIQRNIASSSWSCSSELKQHPEKVHSIGAAAMLARADQFKDCGPFCRYFASLGMAHIARSGDMGIEEAEAMKLGIAPVASVKDALVKLYDDALPASQQMRELVNHVVPMRDEEFSTLYGVWFENPFDLELARMVIPFSIWNPDSFKIARR